MAYFIHFYDFFVPDKTRDLFSHATDVMETQGWKTMITQQPHLIAEAFKALATQQIPPIGPPRKRIKHSV